MFDKLIHKIAHIYDTKYKQLFYLSIVIFILSLIVIGEHYVETEEFVSKGVSLKGGTTLTLVDSINTDEMASFLIAKYPHSDINVRSLSKAGASDGAMIEASDITPEQLLSSVEEKIGMLDKSKYTIDTTGSSLGQSFFNQAILAVIAAFVLMSIVVYLYFRDPYPSFYVIFCVFADMMFALAVFVWFDMRLTTAGVAAFLMLIGYSIDTDILLTTRVLKRTEGTVSQRMASAIPTGMTMTFAAIVAVVVGYYSTSSEVMKQIMFILIWGLFADVIFTWMFNASLLRMHVESLEKKKAQVAENGN